MIRTVITLRACFCGTAPRPGELMAAATRGTVYRIDAVVTLRQAGGQAGSHRYRLTCARLAPSEVPHGVEIHPWRWGSRAPRQTAVQAAPMPWVAPPKQHTQGRPGGSVRRTEAHAGGDFGPVIRRNAVRDRRGRLLREPDVEVDDQAAGDPRYPNRHMRRARRVDSIDLLRRDGTIGRREVEAAGELRAYLERVAPSVAGGGLTRVGIAPHLCQPITDTHLRAARKLREASAALGSKHWPAVLWICLGGSVRGYAAQWHVGTHRASALVGDGLARLGDHFYGRAA
jgi:hypothetical protein